MWETKHVTVQENPNVAVGKDLFILISGFLGAIKILLAAPPFNVEIPQETFDAVINLISFGFAGYAIYKNTYGLTKKGKQQKSVLQQAGLKK